MPATSLVPGIVVAGFLGHCVICAVYRRCWEEGKSVTELPPERCRWMYYLFALGLSILTTKAVLYYSYNLPWLEVTPGWSYEKVPDVVRLLVAAWPLLMATTGRAIFRVTKHWLAWALLVAGCILSAFYPQFMILLAVATLGFWSILSVGEVMKSPGK